jgi:hypothetical protein
MDFALLDDFDRSMLARDLAAAAEGAPVLAGLAAAARAAAGDDGPLTWECGPGDRAGISEALEAAYAAARRNGSGATLALLRLVAEWHTFTGPSGRAAL